MCGLRARDNVEVGSTDAAEKASLLAAHLGLHRRVAVVSQRGAEHLHNGWVVTPAQITT